jgi:hypothetical protein
MKVTLTLANAQEKISQRTGKPYTALSIKTVEFGERWLNGFGGKISMNWAPGMQVYIRVVEKPNPNGGANYLNFDVVEPDMGFMEERMKRIEDAMGLPAMTPPGRGGIAPAAATGYAQPQAHQAPAAPAYQPQPQGMPTHPAFLQGQPAPQMMAPDEPVLDDLPF